MSTQELAQKILDMIKATEQASALPLAETYAVDNLTALVEDIEKLCKEHLAPPNPPRISYSQRVY